MWGWHMDGDWSWWMLFGGVWMVVFWGIVVWAVVVLAQRLGAGQQPPKDEGDALTILERRYARGELTGEEFEAMRRRILGREAQDKS